MEAEDLHVAELISWPNGKNLLRQDRRLEGSAGAIRRQSLLPPGGRHRCAGRRNAVVFQFAGAARLRRIQGRVSAACKIDSLGQVAGTTRGSMLQKAYGWDLPIWVASGQLDSVQLANSNLGRKSAVDSEAGGKPRDKLFFPGSHRQRPLVGEDLLSPAQLRATEFRPPPAAARARSPIRWATTACTCTSTASSATKNGGRPSAKGASW